MHVVAIMGDSQCMMIEASMLSANDHETYSCCDVCVYTTSLSHFTLIMAVKIPYLSTDHTIFMFALCVTVGLYWSV